MPLFVRVPTGWLGHDDGGLLLRVRRTIRRRSPDQRTRVGQQPAVRTRASFPPNLRRADDGGVLHLAPVRPWPGAPEHRRAAPFRDTHPPFVDQAWLAFALLVGVVLLPLGVGLAGYLVPTAGERPAGASVLREILRGYLLAPLIGGLLIFLAGVGVVRKIRSQRHRWSDVHVPIVVKPGGYDQMVLDLQNALTSVDLPVAAEDAPWVLTLPARLLSLVAGGNVRKLRPDRLVELKRTDLRIGVYPSDIAISGTTRDRTRALQLDESVRSQFAD